MFFKYAVVRKNAEVDANSFQNQHENIDDAEVELKSKDNPDDFKIIKFNVIRVELTSYAEIYIDHELSDDDEDALSLYDSSAKQLEKSRDALKHSFFNHPFAKKTKLMDHVYVNVTQDI